MAPLLYRFNPRRGLYEWVKTGPMSAPGIFEGNISPHGSDWIIAARREARAPGVAWMRVSDPFSETAAPVVPEDVKCVMAPLSAYKCPDGITRRLHGRSHP